MKKFVKYASDSQKLYQLVQQDTRMQHLDWETANVIKTVTNSRLNLKYNETEEHVDMCKAIEDMRKECWDNGKMEGRMEGKTEGKLSALSQSILALMDTLQLSAEETVKKSL